jgi:hypothetical protein
MSDVATKSRTCQQCGKRGGKRFRVTFVGAPDGGVPVHVECTQAFFEHLDQNTIGAITNAMNEREGVDR